MVVCEHVDRFMRQPTGPHIPAVHVEFHEQAAVLAMACNLLLQCFAHFTANVGPE